MKDKLIVVTGAAGFIGAHLVHRLLEFGNKVRILVHSNAQRAKFKNDGIEIVIGDLLSKSSMAGLCTNADVVFHLGSTMAFNIPDSKLLDVNVGGTEKIIQLAKEEEVPRFILVSSGGIHNNKSGEPANEESEIRPENIYLDSKIRAEAIAKGLYKSDPGPLTIIRPSLVYEPGDWRRLKLYRAIARGYFIMIGSGTTLIQPVYCDDLVDGLILAAGDKGRGETFLLGGPLPITMNDFANAIADAAGKSVFPLKIPAGPVRIAAVMCELMCKMLGVTPPLSPRRLSFFLKHRTYDISKARNLLGYEPLISVDEGVRRALLWYKKQDWL
jgi:nucleoside-diphosphate-sugar epimerase